MERPRAGPFAPLGAVLGADPLPGAGVGGRGRPAACPVQCHGGKARTPNPAPIQAVDAYPAPASIATPPIHGPRVMPTLNETTFPAATSVAEPSTEPSTMPNARVLSVGLVANPAKPSRSTSTATGTGEPAVSARTTDTATSPPNPAYRGGTGRVSAVRPPTVMPMSAPVP